MTVPRDIQMPIDAHSWHGLTRALTHLCARAHFGTFEGYKRYCILYAAQRQRSIACRGPVTRTILKAARK